VTTTDLTLILPDRVGTLAGATAALSSAGIEFEGCAGFPAWAGEGILHVLVEDVDRARESLRAAGIDVREERELLVSRALGGAEDIAQLLERVAAAGVNVDLIYTLRGNRLAIGVNDLARATRAAGDLAGEPVETS
jgi:hypothetical protein